MFKMANEGEEVIGNNTAYGRVRETQRRVHT